MIPYFQFISFNIGPVTIQVWGLMVSLGILAALAVMSFVAKKRGLDHKRIPDLGFWVILSALIGGRIFHIIGELSYYLDKPIEMFEIWQGGMSVSGGFVLALLAGYLYCKRAKLDFSKYAEVAMFSLPLGLFIGRIGCFLIYDHPGKETGFFLGQEFVDGIVRHNHGLYLSLNGLFLFIIFLIIYKFVKNKHKYIYSLIFLLEYGVVRFFLDFYRVGDPLFFGLTIAQYLSILMVIGGGWLLYRNVKK